MDSLYYSRAEKPSVRVRYDEIPVATKSRRRRNWKPFAIRTPFLVSVLVLLLSCVVALEVLIHRSVPFTKPAPEQEERRLHKREPVTSVTTTAESTFVESTFFLNVDSSVSTTPSTKPLATPTVVATYTNTDGYLNLDTSTDQAVSSPSATPTAPEPSASTPGSNAYLTLDPNTENTVVAPSATPSATPAPVTYTNTDGYLNLDSSTENTPLTPASTGYLNLDSSAGDTASTSVPAATTPAATYTNANGYLNLDSTTEDTSSASPPSPTATGATSYHTNTGSYLKVGSSTEDNQGSSIGVSMTQEPADCIIQTVVQDATVVVGGPLPRAPSNSATCTIMVTDFVTSTVVNTQTATEAYLSLGTNPSTYVHTTPQTYFSSNSDGYLKVDTSTILSASDSITVTQISSSFSTTGSKKDGKSQSTVSSQSQSQSQSTMIQVVSITSVRTSDGQLITSVILSSSTRTQIFISSTGSAIIDEISALRQPNRIVSGQVTESSYFTALYIPSIVAVMLKESWSIIASGLKMMDPFYSMNHPDGASIKETLMSDYLASTMSLNSLAMAIRGSGLIIAVILVNIIMSLLAPLAVESMGVLVLEKYTDSDGLLVRKNPAWVLSLPLIRTLQATLGFVALVVVLVAILVWRRRSGLSANPSKIATMAALLSHPTVVQDLYNIDPNASDKHIAQSIAHNRYAITEYETTYGNVRCGVTRVGDTVPQGLHRVPLEDITSPRINGGLPQSGLHSASRTKTSIGQVCYDSLLLILIVGLLVVIVAYWFDGSDSGFNRFFNSGTFGPRFVLSLGASVVAITFEGLEHEVRLMTPYLRLAARQAGARRTVLQSVDGTASTSLLRSIRYRDWYHAFVASISLLSYVLIITVAGVPFNDSLTFLAFKISTFVSISILLLMLTAAISNFVWRRNNRKMDLPMHPNDTLIRVWMSLSNKGNHLRTMLNDAGDMKEGAIRARLRQDGGLYFAGWIRDDYGRDVWCVDKES